MVPNACEDLLAAAKRGGGGTGNLRRALERCAAQRVSPQSCRNRVGRDALCLAASHGSAADVRLLLGSVARTTALHHHHHQSNASTFDPNTEDIHGIRPLSIAAQRGNAMIIQLLLRAGAKPDVQDMFGIAAIHKAAAFGHAAAVKALLSNSSSIDANTPTGYVTAPHHLEAKSARNLMPLHLAVRASSAVPRSNRCETAATLLDGGAAVNGRDEVGRTPLHACCGECN